MAITNPTPITALPTPPSTVDPVNFDNRADAFLLALPTLRTEVNTISTVNYNNALDAEISASEATAQVGLATAQVILATAQANTAAIQASNAAASAITAASAAGAPTWANTGASYAIGDLRRSPSTGKVYRRIVAGTAGTTDPSIDSTNWMLFSLYPTWAPITSNYTAVPGDALLVDTTNGTFTITLPANPPILTTILLAGYNNSMATNRLIVGRNGQKINRYDEDMDIYIAWLPELRLTYIDATVGWRTF